MRTLALIAVLGLAGCPWGPTIDDSPVDWDTDDTQDTDPDDTDTEDTEPVDAPPEAAMVLPAEVYAGDIAVLDGSASSDPQGYDLAYAWSCTGGVTASGAQAHVMFPLPGPVECTLEVTSTSGLSDDAVGSLDVRDRQPADVADWTILVYLNGDNDIEANALEDLNEMELVGSTDRVQVVVQLDRSTRYDRSDGDWTGARRYRVIQDADMSHIATPYGDELGRVDSGAPDTVVAFVEWAVARYPAERYALILWDHGWGWDRKGAADGTKGVSLDEDTGNDISVAQGELAAMLADTVTLTDGRLEVVGFDACLMGSWEVAHATAPYARVFAASQATEGLDGWAWDAFLREVVAQPDVAPAQLADLVAQTYIAESESGSTFSVVDLEALGQLDVAIDALAGAALASGDATTVVDIASHAQDFEWGYGSDRDLGHAASMWVTAEVAPEVQRAAHGVLTAYDAAVLSSYTFGYGVDDATGLSIYAPTHRVDRTYADGTWAADTRWDELLTAAR